MRFIEKEVFLKGIPSKWLFLLRSEAANFLGDYHEI